MTENRRFASLYIPGVLFMLSLGVSCCQKSRQSASETIEKEDSISYLTNYNPPVFKDPDRVKKILSLQQDIDDLFDSYAPEHHSPGYTYGVVVDDSLLFTHSGGKTNLTDNAEVGVHTKFHIASMTKSFIAMGILKLRDDHKLSLDDAVEQYLPEVANSRYLTGDLKRMTIRNMLTMTSGLPEDNPWADRRLEDSPQQFMDLLNKGINFSAPPSSYEYSNLGFAMLGAVITEVSGMSYREYVTNNILIPLGMKDTYWEYNEVSEDQLAHGYRWEEGKWKEEPMLHTGAFGAIGGIITSMQDFSKYVAFHLSAYPPRTEPERGPIRRSSVREMHQMTSPQLRIPSDNSCPYIQGYGYGLRIVKNCEGVVKIGHSGGLPGFGSNYSFYPEYGVGIISFFNLTYAPAYAMNDEAIRMIMDSGIEPRSLPPSAILIKRKKEVVDLLTSWDDDLGTDILSENFYLDKSKQLRKKDFESLSNEIGSLDSIGPIIPYNQLRGEFMMYGEKGNLRIFFSLDPTPESRIQAVNITKRTDE